MTTFVEAMEALHDARVMMAQARRDESNAKDFLAGYLDGIGQNVAEEGTWRIERDIQSVTRLDQKRLKAELPETFDGYCHEIEVTKYRVIEILQPQAISA